MRDNNFKNFPNSCPTVESNALLLSEPLRAGQTDPAKRRSKTNCLQKTYFSCLLLMCQHISSQTNHMSFSSIEPAHLQEEEGEWCKQDIGHIRYQETDGQKHFHKILALCDSLSPSASALLLFFFFLFCLYAVTTELYILFYLNCIL